MPSIDEIIQAAVSSKELNSIDLETPDEGSEKKASEKKEISEAEKVATILERISEDDDISDSGGNEKEKEDGVVGDEEGEEGGSEEEEKVCAEEKFMEKMAVGATIVDTLRSLDEKGISEKAFRKYFQENK